MLKLKDIIAKNLTDAELVSYIYTYGNSVEVELAKKIEDLIDLVDDMGIDIHESEKSADRSDKILALEEENKALEDEIRKLVKENQSLKDNIQFNEKKINRLSAIAVLKPV